MSDVVYSPRSVPTIASPVRRVYLLYGEDDHQKSEAVDQIREATTDPSFADFDVEYLDAVSSPADTIFAAAGLAPFGSPYRLVVVKNAEGLRARDRQGSADRLAAGIADLGPATCLVLVANSNEDTLRGKTVLTSKLDSAIRNSGLVVRCRPLTEEGLMGWLRSEAVTSGKLLSDEAGHRLITSSRGERTSLENELAKAICYAGDREEITLADIEAVCSYDAEDVMFKLVDAVSQRNCDRALSLLREILRFDTKPQGVAGRLISLLTRQLRFLWQARELIDRRYAASVVRSMPPELAEELPADGAITSMAWKAGDLFRFARIWPRDALTRAFDAVLRCDLSNKGGLEGTENVVINMELLIVDLCAAY